MVSEAIVLVDQVVLIHVAHHIHDVLSIVGLLVGLPVDDYLNVVV